MTTTLEALKAIPGFNILTEQGDYQDETIIEGAIGREGFGDYISRADAIAAQQAEQGQEPDEYQFRTFKRAAGIWGSWCRCDKQLFQDIKSEESVSEYETRSLYTTPPASQWVSVKERLPEEGETVLAIMKAKWGKGLYKTCPTIAACVDGRLPSDVTHWIPLPTPPLDSTDAGDKHE